MVAEDPALQNLNDQAKMQLKDELGDIERRKG